MNFQKQTVLIILALFLLPPAFPQQTEPVRKVIATLQPNENLVYGENCFMLTAGKQGALFITVVNDDKPIYYFYNQNQRKGPLTEPPLYFLDSCSNTEPFCGAYEQPIQELPDSKIESDGDHNYFLNNGKKYGPYEAIVSVYFSKDRKSSAAMVMKNSKMLFINHDGKETLLSGIVNDVFVSPDCKTFFAKTQGTHTMEEISKIDANDMETLSKLMEDLEQQFIYLPDGQKIGPFSSAEGSGIKTWYSAINPEHWLCLIDHDIFLNDNKLCTIAYPPSICSFWVSEDGKKYAWSDYENICFYDGKCYPYPLSINYINESKKGSLVWISIENQKDVVLYKMPF